MTSAVGPDFGAPGGDINRLHDYDDVDIGTLSHHHTLGISSGQATPGDHLHDGRQSKKLAFSTGFLGQPVRMTQARINAAAAVPVAAALTDIPGCTVNVTLNNPNGLAVVTGIIDFQVTVAGGAGSLALGQLLLDGLNVINSLGATAQQIIMDTIGLTRRTVSQSWLVEFGTAGVHNLKMQAGKSAGSTATVQMGAAAAVAHTGFTVVLLDAA